MHACVHDLKVGNCNRENYHFFKVSVRKKRKSSFEFEKIFFHCWLILCKEGTALKSQRRFKKWNKDDDLKKVNFNLGRAEYFYKVCSNVNKSRDGKREEEEMYGNRKRSEEEREI